MAKAIYIVGNQGLGDQLVLNGLYRYFAKEYEFCVIGIANRYQSVLKSMLRDVRNVYVSGYRMEFWESNIYAHRGILERVGYTTLSLGEFATLSYAKETESLDENLYRQASIPHSVRWNNFYYIRDRHKEKSLYDSLGCGSGPYIFLHEDLSRGYKIREELVPSEFNIVRPNPKLKGFSLFDYLAVMENAQEIHCIESSFAILAEQMRLERPKYAHRYARPDVPEDMLYSYQTSWNIIT